MLCTGNLAWVEPVEMHGKDVRIQCSILAYFLQGSLISPIVQLISLSLASAHVPRSHCLPCIGRVVGAVYKEEGKRITVINVWAEIARE